MMNFLLMILLNIMMILQNSLLNYKTFKFIQDQSVLPLRLLQFLKIDKIFYSYQSKNAHYCCLNLPNAGKNCQVPKILISLMFQ